MSATKVTLAEELEMFRTQCFWWVRRDVRIIDLTRETLLKGLRTYGGHAGMLLAARLP